jgi:hypothetical protein
MSSKHLGQRLVCFFSSAILTNESLRINSEEVEDLKIGGVRAIPLSLDKSSDVETFEEGTLSSWVIGVGLNCFAGGSSFFIIEGFAMLTIEASKSSGRVAKSTTTSTGVDVFASGVHFLASWIDFSLFLPFLTESFVWALDAEVIWPFKTGSNDSWRETSEDGVS